MHTHAATLRLVTPSLQDFLTSLPILDREVIIRCCTQQHPIEDVCDWLGISPRQVARILLRTLQFTEEARKAGVAGPAALMTNTLETQARKYLEGQDCSSLTRQAGRFAPFGAASANYGVN
jgi:hypothetical protein